MRGCNHIIIAVALALLAACGGGNPQNGELVVLTRHSPTTYYLDSGGRPAGPDVDLLTDFASSQGWSVRFKPVDGIDKLLKALQQGRGHVAAVGLSGLSVQGVDLRASEPFQIVDEMLVCRRGGPNPDHLEDLAEAEIVVAADTVYEQRMVELESKIPGLTWRVLPLDVEDLLEKVWEGEAECTLADSLVAAVNRRYHAELTVPLQLPVGGQYSWYMPSISSELESRLNTWLQDYRRRGELARTLDRHYGKLATYDYVDTRRFLRRINQRLPQYRSLFEEAAGRYGFEWTTLAAMAYQESHWNALARSPTGVRGMMMLTLGTARELGVDSRLDAVQSIHGGARYLAMLRDRLPPGIEEPDRTWLALAAYNVGYAHLQDAMKLADEQGRRGDEWHVLKEVLPLLEHKVYYRRTRHGHARGQEPVSYVIRIRNYEDILVDRLRRRALRIGKINIYKSTI